MIRSTWDGNTTEANLTQLALVSTAETDFTRPDYWVRTGPGGCRMKVYPLPIRPSSILRHCSSAMERHNYIVMLVYFQNRVNKVHRYHPCITIPLRASQHRCTELLCIFSYLHNTCTTCLLQLHPETFDSTCLIIVRSLSAQIYTMSSVTFDVLARSSYRMHQIVPSPVTAPTRVVYNSL